MFTPKIIWLFFLTAIVANTMYMWQKYTVPYSPAFVYMVSFLFAGVVSW
jgi:hypothetical protein